MNHSKTAADCTGVPEAVHVIVAEALETNQLDRLRNAFRFGR
jgi:hypothetical protein